MDSGKVLRYPNAARKDEYSSTNNMGFRLLDEL
jgi:hypothetical protein